MSKPLRLLTAVLFAALPVFASAQKTADTFPTRPIRMLVAQAAGGPTDIVARAFATRVSEILGQQVVVGSRPGAGAGIAGDITSRSPADGYTLMIAANGTFAVAPHMIKLTYDARKDLASVALIGTSALRLTAHAETDVRQAQHRLRSLGQGGPRIRHEHEDVMAS